MIDLRVLGGLDFRVRDGPEILSVLAQPKRTALLCYLALARPRGCHRRDTLLALFWPDADTEHARASLRQSVHFLRRSLGEDAIRSRGDEEVGLGEGLVWCDALELEEALDAGDPERALALYGGDLLPGFFLEGAPEFERWLGEERRRLKQRAAKAAWSVAEARERASDTGGAVEWGRRALVLAPDDDTLLRGFMELMARAGDRGAALAEYEGHARRLQQELEVEPSPAVRALAESIRHQPPAPMPRSSAAAGMTRPAVEPQNTAPRPVAVEDKPAADAPVAPVRSLRGFRIVAILAAAAVLLIASTVVWHWRASVAGPNEAEATSPRSIAVLPFENLSSDKEQGYFADGISEDILDMLTKVSALRVAARTSSFSFKGKALKVQDIARQLDVANVLQGSLQRSGERVRISVQLVHAADGYQVWSQTWDRWLGDVFAIQDEIARDVAAQLQVKLLGRAAPAARPTDPQTYALFLQARELSRQLRRDAVLRSDSLLRQVLAADPRYAPAWTWQAANFLDEAMTGVLPLAMGRRRAREAAGKALAIDPDDAIAHAIVSFIVSQEGDLAAGAREMERAIALDPTDPEVLGLSVALLSDLGRMEEAIGVAKYLVARDPVNPDAFARLGAGYGLARRYDDAIACFRTALSLNPGIGTAHYLLGRDLLLKGNRAAGLAEIRLEPTDLLRTQGLAMVYHALARNPESDSALAELIRAYPENAAFNIAFVYAYRGEADRAFAWLETAAKQRSPRLWRAPLNPFFDPIHADPRWLPFLRRNGMAPEQLAKIRLHVRLPESGTAPRNSALP